MNKQKTILGLTALAIATGVVFTTASSALAYRGDPSVQGPNYTVERHEAMVKAFENRDFDAWFSLMQGRSKATQVINKDNFTKFAEAHDLMKNGKIEEAKQIRTELGLGLQNGLGRGHGQRRMGR